MITIKDSAKLLNVTERTIYRYIKAGQIASHKIGTRIFIERPEILYIARQKGLFLEDNITPVVNDNSIEKLLRKGGIYYRVEAPGIEAALASALEMNGTLPPNQQQKIVQELLKRELVHSTGIGDGIAIPHSRDIINLFLKEPLLILAFLDAPLEYAALDGNPVDTLMIFLSTEKHHHYDVMAKLNYMFLDKNFRNVIKKQKSRKEIFYVVNKMERKLTH